jgi:SAM-dependent methyltransferase
VYEKFFVPALFGQWVEPMLDAVNVVEGDRLLDIGTGTGVVARAALRRVSAGGSVVAVDPNDGMLAVAKRLTPGPPRPHHDGRVGPRAGRRIRRMRSSALAREPNRKA